MYEIKMLRLYMKKPLIFQANRPFDQETLFNLLYN
jgi:hypothetical protein